MTQGRKTGGRDFAKGHKGGPGRPPLPEDLKGVKALTQEAVKRRVAQLLEMPYPELTRLKKSRNKSVMDALLIEVIENAKKYGDHARLEFLFQRCVGKVKEEVDVNVKHRFELPSVETARQILEADYATLPAPPAKVEDL